ncbi:hypothetical protein EVAR_17066_1 [Eumeta japonica]|uniref:Uncharacterized protein n=1 Tax=Eumeta variegata TaxID=151549 RepID=A0A4C1V4K5_EUMVA|nr:hypothetical protein EVAR_17066_1 [Eumeta japonica]
MDKPDTSGMEDSESDCDDIDPNYIALEVVGVRYALDDVGGVPVPVHSEPAKERPDCSEVRAPGRGHADGRISRS